MKEINKKRKKGSIYIHQREILGLTAYRDFVPIEHHISEIKGGFQILWLNYTVLCPTTINFVFSILKIN